MTGDEIESISDLELEGKIKKIRVFARVSPNHKLRIVRAFKKKGNCVRLYSRLNEYRYRLYQY